jgi:hypothetical protein
MNRFSDTLLALTANGEEYAMDEGSALKGTIFGILFTLPIWVFVGWLVLQWIK